MSPKEFLEFIISSIVTQPESIQIEEKNDELGTLLSLRVHPDDMKLVIGRSGKTIDSIRTVLRVRGSKENKRINIRLIEDEPTR